MTFLSFHGFSDFFVFVASVLMGISLIMGPNTVNSAPSFMLNYFQYIYQDENAVSTHSYFWANVLTFYGVVTQITQMLLEPTNLTRFFQRFSLLFRLEAATMLMLVELLMVVIMPHTCRSESGAMAGLMLAAFIGGVGRAYFENTCYALYGPFPPKYLAGVMIGVPLSGVIVSVLQIILLAAMNDSYNSILTESIIYFAVSLGIIFVAGLCVVLLLFNSFARRYVAEFRSERSVWANIYTNVNEEPQVLEAIHAADRTLADRLEDSSKSTGGAAAEGVNNEPMSGAAQLDSALANKEKKLEGDLDSEEGESAELQAVPNITSAEFLQEVRLWPIVKKIWPMMVACWMTFMVTCLIFPGVLIVVDATDNWYTTLVVAIYNFGDVFGRLLSVWKRLWPPRSAVFVASLVRIIFIPLLLLCAKHVITSHAAAFVLSALVGVSTGFIGTLSMVYSAETPALSSDAERASAGQLTGVCILVGCSFGSLLQLAVVLGL
ncbi:nucleobase transporter [Leptomonas pyrrhocoris]|uniref:Nucleobase transporter n=1 Tax=Leptomonas pyrrhocoris TaxID=157538 RepID=A0A0N0DTE2_LEPPY|nr:nucleobase transporter [Leptomonas pyrrhocoris]XP_015655421.1 nucleobase transporter [Leptomonas pyrrhocoris]KPA76981.1 nucleobase transporter [Leptomonas pyrrhocoris]KPA76982.1 nucleobase transporter [Leptomonas pyrrhocoris]|eukprot:XP_015655420.1 nucleobase transporter [Leptomonas pyrrhocoris]